MVTAICTFISQGVEIFCIALNYLNEPYTAKADHRFITYLSGQGINASALIPWNESKKLNDCCTYNTLVSVGPLSYMFFFMLYSFVVSLNLPSIAFYCGLRSCLVIR